MARPCPLPARRSRFGAPLGRLLLTSKAVDAAAESLDASYRREAQARVQAQADWMSLLPEVRAAATGARIDTAFFRGICENRGIRQLILNRPSGVPILPSPVRKLSDSVF